MFLIHILKTDLTQGLYPTLIIILVSKQMSPVEHYSTHSIEMHFTGVPDRVTPRNGGVPRDELTIRRDPTPNPGTQIPKLQFPSAAFVKAFDEKYLA